MKIPKFHNYKNKFITTMDSNIQANPTRILQFPTMINDEEHYIELIFYKNKT